MADASKILTVSYGTFSCTLEGFDDSFSTMKAIAEYFRDLAADDRYFGAEPPIPDVEMLARIAEREVQQRVEAKMDGNEVVLRRTPGVTLAAPQVEEVAKATKTTETAEVAETIVTAEAAETFEPAQDPQHTQDTVAEPAALAQPLPDAPTADSTDLDANSVAAKLRRIRDVVAKNKANDASAALYTEDGNAQDLMSDASLSNAMSDDADTDADVVADDIHDALDEPAITAADNIIARAAEHADNTQNDEFIEDLEDEAVAVESIAAVISTDTSADTPQDDANDDQAILDALSNLTQDDEAEQEDVTAESATESIVVEDDHDALLGDSDDLIASIAGITADDDAVAGENLFTAEADDEEAHDETVSEAPLQQPATNGLASRARARVVKLKRADLVVPQLEEENAADDIDFEDDYEDELRADIEDVVGDTQLSHEDETELLDELADVEMDASDDITSMLRADRADRALGERSRVNDEVAVSRLMEETDVQLDSSEGKSRRSAISHLKAAVAATVADRKMGKSVAKDVDAEEKPYRTVLADVVRPRRPLGRRRTDTDTQPTPLVLVSEQRVDPVETPAPKASVEAQAAVQQIRPRRVAKHVVDVAKAETVADTNDTLMAASAEIGHATSFAEFADAVDAVELPDLLEAAAAYTAYVEGQPFFSRPQIMRQLAAHGTGDEFNREDGLRSFGQLLRQGKIIKIKRGQFEIAETTRFKPQARIAGE